jgi:hypothetical protein
MRKAAKIQVQPLDLPDEKLLATSQVTELV